MTRRRVLIADRHTILREGVVAVLRRDPEVEVVAEAESGAEALERIGALGPDVAVLDAALSTMTGIEVARRVREGGLRTAVLIVAAQRDATLVRGALDAGASGLVARDARPHELLDAVRAAAAGGFYLGPRVAPVGLAALRGAPASGSPLTPRERDVLRLLSRGLTSKEIAREAGITPKTVEGFRAAIMAKLGIRHVAGLVKYAIRHDLASLEE